MECLMKRLQSILNYLLKKSKNLPVRNLPDKIENYSMEEMCADEQIGCVLADEVPCERSAKYSKLPFGKKFYMMHLII